MTALLLVLGGGVQAVQSAETAVPPFFVAINGNDQWSGHLLAPNSAKTDGPLATIPHALDVIRRWRASSASGSNQQVTLSLAGGFYFLPQPVVLTPDDSDLLLTVNAGAKAFLCGGRPITGWKQVIVDAKQLWVADVPEARAGKWYFRGLWVNNHRAVRARHPNHGYLKVADVPDRAPDWTHGQMRFAFHPGDLEAWPTLTNAELIVMNRWVESRLPVFSVDQSEHIVRFNKRPVFDLAKGDLYYLEGAFESLDEPEKWYLDAAAGKLYYLPRPGDHLETVQAIAPVLAQVMRFEGKPEANRFVERVTVRDLSFAFTEWCFPEGFETNRSKLSVWPPPDAQVGGFAQAAIGVPGAVWGEGARDCLFDGCTFAHLGNYGLELARGCQDNRILHCDFWDLGAGGIKLGETAIRSQPSEQTRGNEVSDCHIHDGGKLFHSAIGLWVGQSPNNRIVHNLIHDFYYTGISIGWTWGYGPALATNNLVAFNHVHHVGVKSDGDGPILSDMGGIYTLGMQPGTRIVNNLWHDIAGIQYGGWGIYFDEGSSSIVAESNVVYRTTHGGFHQHYGATNVVRNNIFAFARDQQLQRTRPESHFSFSFTTNIVYFDSGVLLGGDWSKDQYGMDWNLYFDARPGVTPEAMRFADATLEQWRARGHDVNSLIGNPAFIAPGKNDFGLPRNSPAFRLGFQPIDLSQVGIRNVPEH